MKISTKMNIPFVDLNAQYDTIKDLVNKSIGNVIREGRFIQGEEVNLFETEFANFLGSKYCITVASGTDALILGIKGLGLKQDSEIIIPDNTFYSTALAATFNRLKPVFVDIDEEDFGINLDDLKRKINKNTKAIIVVHLYGQPDKIDEIKNIIRQSGQKIYLIEDACQAHGAVYKNKKVGSFGIFSAFSFYPGKNLGAYGDGGAIVTNNRQLADKFRLLSQLGQKKKYLHIEMGTNSRLDTIQAAILRVKLRHLRIWNEHRHSNALEYNSLLANMEKFIKLPTIKKERKSVFHLYVIRAKERNKLIKFLNKEGINCLMHYPVPLHLQGAFNYLGYKIGDFPITEKEASSILSLPMYPELTKEQISYIAFKIKKFYEKV
ncbi:MAG: DegT/DnrJ/EryC1/StrS family aminotransferase [Actinobacteria bacterium]|nr:DegT/DnrJ/EryC1/StrS family aminotransferase [Actinomycetota bacterium]